MAGIYSTFVICALKDAYDCEEESSKREREREIGDTQTRRERDRDCMEWRIVHQSIGAQVGYCAQSGLNYSGDSNYDPSVIASYFWASARDPGGLDRCGKLAFIPFSPLIEDTSDAQYPERLCGCMNCDFPTWAQFNMLFSRFFQRTTLTVSNDGWVTTLFTI